MYSKSYLKKRKVINPLTAFNSACNKPGKDLGGLSRSTTSTVRQQEVWKEARREQQESQRFCKHDQIQKELEVFFGKNNE